MIQKFNNFIIDRANGKFFGDKKSLGQHLDITYAVVSWFYGISTLVGLF